MLLEHKLDINYFEELEIDDYFRLSRKLFIKITEEKQIEDYYSMYLALFPMMIKKEIEWQSFKEFLDKNMQNKKVEEKIIETSKTNEEILRDINSIQFE